VEIAAEYPGHEPGGAGERPASDIAYPALKGLADRINCLTKLLVEYTLNHKLMDYQEI